MTMTTRDALTRHWPVFGLRLATPRLILRPVTDDDLAELVDLALAGVHDAAEMPFLVPWTDALRDELISEMLRHHWRSRAASRPENWSLHLAVRSRGELLGTQEISGEQFAVTATVRPSIVIRFLLGSTVISCPRSIWPE